MPSKDANYDEDQVPTYTLPDPLIAREGRVARLRNFVRHAGSYIYPGIFLRHITRVIRR